MQHPQIEKYDNLIILNSYTKFFLPQKVFASRLLQNFQDLLISLLNCSLNILMLVQQKMPHQLQSALCILVIDP